MDSIKKVIPFLLTIIATASICIFWNKSTVKKQTTENRQRVADLIDQNAKLKNQLVENEKKSTKEKDKKEAPQTKQIKNREADVLSRFNDVTTKVFQNMYNFSPQSFATRKESVQDFLSENLLNQYFGEKKNIGDSAGVTSKLLDLKIYTKAVSGEKLEGFVVVTFESSNETISAVKKRDLYQIAYDDPTQKITDIKYLGALTTGDLLE